jgi:hypothetical protein
VAGGLFRRYHSQHHARRKREKNQQHPTAERTLEVLWKDGESKRKEFLRNPNSSWLGTVVVIDEGHLFAPPETPDPQSQLVSERIQRFADQGKKLKLNL